MAYTRSVSQLKGMTTCGERFFLERIKRYQLPPTPAAWTALGVAVHETFCEWEKRDRKIDALECFAECYDGYINEAMETQPDLSMWQTPPGTKTTEASIKNYRRRGLEKDVPNYLARCLEADWEIYRLPDGTKALELEYEITLEKTPVRGSIDRVLWWPEQHRATLEDLKTGNVDEWDSRQLGVYSYAATALYNIPIKWGRYWFTKVDRAGDWIDLSRYNYDYLSDIYGTLNGIIDAGYFLPNPGKHCELCGVRPYCREQGWMKP